MDQFHKTHLLRTITISFCAIALVCPAAIAGPTFEELVEQLRNVNIESWRADMDMTMNLGGMSMTFGGSTLGKGERSRSIMNMDLLGQKMAVSTVLDAEGITWTETTVLDEVIVMKLDMNEMVEDSASIPGMESFMQPFMNTFGGSDMTTMYQRPAEMLEAYTEMYEMKVAGEADQDGVTIYQLEGTLKENFASEFPPEMVQLGLSMDRMRLTIGEDGFMRAMEMLGPDGQPFLTTAMKNVELNIDIPDETFIYTPPEGVEVMDMSDMDEIMAGATEPNGKFGASETAPEFSGTNLAGKTVSLSDYPGKVVLIDFWATWCGPCIQELPNVLETYEQFHPSGLEIIGVSLDESREDLEEFVKARPAMTWEQIFDGKGWDAAIAQQYGVQAIPHTLLLDRTGTIRYVDLRGPALSDAVETLLDEATP